MEVTERNGPLLCHYKRLRPGSGGAGRFRGGLGQDIAFECLSETPVVGLFMTERTRFAAPGFAGGLPGGLGAVEINGKPVDTHKQHVLINADRVLLQTPGGGGYGEPHGRAPERDARDRALGYVT